MTAGLDVQAVTPGVALKAGRLRARHYQRERRAVRLADCLIAAAALRAGQPLATADPALAALVREEGGEVEPLPDSAGEAPDDGPAAPAATGLFVSTPTPADRVPRGPALPERPPLQGLRAGLGLDL